MGKKHDTSGTVTLEQYREGLRPEGYDENEIHSWGRQVLPEQDPWRGHEAASAPTTTSRASAHWGLGMHVISDSDN